MGFAFAFGAATEAAQIGISYLFPSDGPRLKDLKVAASTYGAVIPYVFGVLRVPGNMIWSLPIKETKKKDYYGIGKGGAYYNYTYSCTFAMGLCAGPVGTITRIWADGKTIFDGRGAGGLSLDNLGVAGATPSGTTFSTGKYNVRFYTGDEEQMPDAALSASLGEDQCPAFRGLSYLVFDDIPLLDFGNRIPQITAEVYCGTTDVTLLTVPLTEMDGTTPIATTYVTQETAPDWERGYLYLRDANKLRRMSLDGEKIDHEFTLKDFAFPQTTTNGLDDGSLAKLLCVSQSTGDIFVQHGSAAAQMPIDRLDAYSCLTLNTFGSSANGVTQSSATGFVPAVNAATAIAQDGTEYLLAVGAAGQIGMLRTADLSYVYGGAYADTGPDARQSYFVVGATPDTSGHPAFYVVHGGDNTGGDFGTLFVTKFDGVTRAEVGSIPNPEAGPGFAPVGAVWDSANPGVVLFYRSATKSYAAKLSIDTSTVVWTLEVPSVPVGYSPLSRAETDEIAWVSGGKLFMVQSATGVFVERDVDPSVATDDGTASQDGQPNWDGYLALYPDVRDAWPGAGSNSNWPTVEDYAKWQYAHFGQAEGRHLPLYGENIGTGANLPTGYTSEPSWQLYDSNRAFLVGLTGLNAVIKTGLSGTGVTVGTVVARLFNEAGLDTTQYDVTALDAIALRGYGWSSPTDVKSVMDTLSRFFLFDITETDGRLVAVRRDVGSSLDGTVSAVIPQGALGSSSDDASDYWQETRIQDADLPYLVTFGYMNYLDNYEVSTAHSQRITNPYPTVFSRQQVTLEMTIVLTPDEAKTRANAILYTQWGERTKHDTRLPWALLDVDPGDLIEVDFVDGRVYRERVHSSNLGADYAMAVESYGQDEGAYIVGNVAADGGGSNTQQGVATPKVAIAFIINTPLLRDLDDTGGSSSRYYTAIGNGAPGKFNGASMFRSTNNLDFAAIGAGDEVEWGVVTSVTPDAGSGPFALDYKTRINILPSVDWFELEPITDDELWAGGNPIMIGDEVMQFRDAVENADGTWTIWNLLRGRRGTEYACATHAAGERFIFLANSTVDGQADTISSRGQTRFFKAVGYGRSLSATPATQISYEPRDLMPYAVANITPQRPAQAGDDYVLTWSRRTRLGGNLMDYDGDVALSEATEAYEVYILAAPFSGDLSRGAAPTSYRRMYATTTPTITYAAADMTSDSFNPVTDTLHVVIYQLSAAIGRGFPSARSIETWERY